MNDITKVGGTLNARESLTSLEIVREINCFREQEKNRSVLKHSDLLKIIRDEFEEEINEGLISSVKYKDAKGEERPMFELLFNQAKQENKRLVVQEQSNLSQPAKCNMRLDRNN